MREGTTEVVLNGFVRRSFGLRPDTAIVRTTLTDMTERRCSHGLCPRFRNFRPHDEAAKLIRIIEPLSGMPRISI